VEEPGAEGDVAVEEERHSPADGVTRRVQILRIHEPMPMRAAGLVRAALDAHVAHLLDRVRLGRRRVMVEEARAPAEALDAEQLLGKQAAVGLAELGMALRWNLAYPAVVRHPCLRGSCPPYARSASEVRAQR
jgi:hypothetical protein